MTTKISSKPKSKRRQKMVISDDKNVLDEIEEYDNNLSKSIISDSKDEYIPNCHSNLKSEKANEKKEKNHPFACVICGSPAKRFNFDVISCAACYRFFRRFALRDPPPKCRYQGNCTIQRGTRRHCCLACRLTKCLNSGMLREKVQIAVQKSEMRRRRRKKQKSNINKKEKKSRLSTHLPRSDAVQKSEIHHSQRQKQSSNINIEENTSRLSTYLSTNYLSSILDQELSLFFDSLQGNLIHSKKAPLSKEDLQRLESLQLIHKKRIELACQGLPWNPSMYTMTFLRQLGNHSLLLRRLLTLFKQLPQLKNLNVDEKVTLIKVHLLPLLSINCTLSYKIKTVFGIRWDPPTIQIIYAMDNYQRMKNIFDQFLYIAKHDQRIIQLALIIFILTKGFAANVDDKPIPNECITMYHAQNYYTELLWKYMEIVYGYEITIQMFSKLIVHFMKWQVLQIEIRDIIEQNLSSRNTKELSSFMKALLHIL